MAPEFRRGENFLVGAKADTVSFNRLGGRGGKDSYPAFLINGCSLPVTVNKVLYAWTIWAMRCENGCSNAGSWTSGHSDGSR